MPTRETAVRTKSVTAVLSSIATHGAPAASAVAADLKRVLKRGETMPDVALLLTLLGRRLDEVNAAAVAADDAHEREKADDEQPRLTRDDAAVKVRDACVHARDGINTAHGTGALKLLGMATPPPSSTDPTGLARWAEGASGKLRDAKISIPAAQKRGIQIDRKALADEIDEHLTTLTDAVKAVERERRELEGTQAAKNRALEQNDALFSVVANLTGAVFRAAGMGDQADRIRPSVRRPGRTVDEEEDQGGEK